MVATVPGPAVTGADRRRAELAGNLAEVRGRIERACASAGRSSDEVTLVAVTKFFPASDVVLLASLGVTDIGENRDQEAAAKAADVRALTADAVRWHFVGQLQTNKARSVARYAAIVHSLDRTELAAALDTAVRNLGRDRLPVLIQVSLDGASGRGGVAPDRALDLAEQVAAHERLQLSGVMAVAPQSADPDDAFDELALVSAGIKRSHPGAAIVSAGMSGDLEAAVRHGATHVRVGAALLGRRA